MKALITLLLLFNFWWAVAMNLDGSHDATVVGEFVLLAISPILLFLQSASVLPRALPVEGQLDMRAEWAQARRIFLVLFWVRQICTGVTAADDNYFKFFRVLRHFLLCCQGAPDDSGFGRAS